MQFRSLIVNAWLALLFVSSSTAKITAGPLGTHTGRWSSLVINSGLANVLRIAANAPGELSRDGQYEVWDYMNAAGEQFTLIVHRSLRSITVGVCDLADEAFNALTGPGGRQFERVAVEMADRLTGFIVDGSPQWGEPDGRFAISLSNQTVSDGDADARSLHTPHCRTGHGKRDETLDITSVEDLDRAADEYGLDRGDGNAKRDADAQHTYVVGYLGPGCTGEQVYVLRGNLFDHCHRTNWNNAESFMVVNPRAGPGHAHVYADKNCHDALGVIRTQTCFPAGQYGSIHRQE